jgi:phospholipase C
MGVSRRRFLKGAAATGGVLTFGGLGSVQRVFSQGATLPPPDGSGIEHIVVLMMENRSFDHMLGWVEGADGRQRGLKYRDAAGSVRRTYPLAPDFQGCGHQDPDHSYEGGRIEYNGGACDGWLRAGNNDDYAIGFYQKKDLPFFGGAAPRWTVCDHYFSAIMAGTFANRIYQHAAQTESTDEHGCAEHAADDLGSPCGRRSRRALLLQRPALPGVVGRQVCLDRPSLCAVPCRRRRRHPAPRVFSWNHAS